MSFLIGFGIGMAFGCWLWWQTLLHGDELHQEYLQTLEELIEQKHRLRNGPSTKPSQN